MLARININYIYNVNLSSIHPFASNGSFMSRPLVRALRNDIFLALIPHIPNTLLESRHGPTEYFFFPHWMVS